MDEQRTNIEIPESPSIFRGFNWGLFLGFCVVAVSIYMAGSLIAGRMPASLHGQLHGNFSWSLVDGGGGLQSEFMSEWQAAHFLMIPHENLERLIEAGELVGIYTVFTVEHRERRPVVGRSEVMSDGTVLKEVPMPTEYDIVLVEQRVFSRERLAEWLLARIDC